MISISRSMYVHMSDRAQDLHPMKIHFVQWNQFKLPPLYQSASIILFEKTTTPELSLVVEFTTLLG